MKRKRPDVSERKKRRKGLKTSTVKMKLNRLKPCKRLVETIETWSADIQLIVFDASRLAAACVSHSIVKGAKLPDISDQTFWNRCLSACSTNGKKLRKCHESLDETFSDIFLPARQANVWGNGSNKTMELTNWALSLKTNACTMVATTFHNRLKASLIREACFQCPTWRNWDRRDKTLFLRASLFNAVRSSDDEAKEFLHDDAQKRAVFEETMRLVDDWRCQFREVLPVRDPQKITSAKLAACFAWQVEMRKHLDGILDTD